MKDFNLDWQKGYEEGLSVGILNEKNRTLRLIQDYKNKPDFTFENLESLIKGEQK